MAGGRCVGEGQKILDGKIDAPQAGAEQSKDRGMGR
jgi:hypothetical protein